MGNELIIIQNSLDKLEREIKYRRYVLTAMEKIYNFYCCITTMDLNVILLSKQIKYNEDLKLLLGFIKDFLKQAMDLSYPINDILVKCQDWKIAIQTIASSYNDAPLLFIAFIPVDFQYYRHAIDWGIKMMNKLHH